VVAVQHRVGPGGELGPVAGDPGRGLEAERAEHVAARDVATAELRGASRKFAFEPAAKLWRVPKLFEAAPVLLAGHRLLRMLKNAFHR